MIHITHGRFYTLEWILELQESYATTHMLLNEEIPPTLFHQKFSDYRYLTLLVLKNTIQDRHFSYYNSYYKTCDASQDILSNMCDSPSIECHVLRSCIPYDSTSWKWTKQSERRRSEERNLSILFHRVLSWYFLARKDAQDKFQSKSRWCHRHELNWEISSLTTSSGSWK